MLNAAAVPKHISLCESEGRIREIEAIFSEVGASFPNIEYELDLNSRTANAQAYARVDKRIVRVYGGLAFHPSVGADTTVFALLHETGHHLAKGRRFANDPMLACDCAADQWAVTVGAETLQRVSGRRLNIVRALDDLDAMLHSLMDTPVQTESTRRAPILERGCWASSWLKRKFRLSHGWNTGVPARCCI